MNGDEYIELISNKISEELDELGIKEFWIRDYKVNYDNDIIIAEEANLEFKSLNDLLKENNK